jgi:hypothetical protein
LLPFAVIVEAPFGLGERRRRALTDRSRVANTGTSANRIIVAAAMDAHVLIALIAAIEATVSVIGNVPLIDRGRPVKFGNGDLPPGVEELDRLNGGPDLPLAHDVDIAVVEPVRRDVAEYLEPDLSRLDESRIGED